MSIVVYSLLRRGEHTLLQSHTLTVSTPLGMPHTLSEAHSPLPGEHTLLYPGGVREAFKSTKKGKGNLLTSSP